MTKPLGAKYVSKVMLTISLVCLVDFLANDPARIVDDGGRVELHGLDRIAANHADL